MLTTYHYQQQITHSQSHHHHTKIHSHRKPTALPATHTHNPAQTHFGNLYPQSNTNPQPLLNPNPNSNLQPILTNPPQIQKIKPSRPKPPITHGHNPQTITKTHAQTHRTNPQPTGVHHKNPQSHHVGGEPVSVRERVQGREREFLRK